MKGNGGGDRDSAGVYSSSLIHISLSKEDDDGDLAYPVYIHVEMEYLKWFEGNYTAILDKCTSCICKNFRRSRVISSILRTLWAGPRALRTTASLQ